MSYYIIPANKTLNIKEKGQVLQVIRTVFPSTTRRITLGRLSESALPNRHNPLNEKLPNRVTDEERLGGLSRRHHRQTPAYPPTGPPVHETRPESPACTV